MLLPKAAAELARSTPHGTTLTELGSGASRKTRLLLASLCAAVGDGGRLLLGIDLRKNGKTLLAAYDDTGGVTAAFNLNLLTRINRELAADIDPNAFVHRAV